MHQAGSAVCLSLPIFCSEVYLNKKGRARPKPTANSVLVVIKPSIEILVPNLVGRTRHHIPKRQRFPHRPSKPD